MTTGRLVRQAAERLAAAGIESSTYDARVLLAHVLGIRLGQLALVESVGADQEMTYDDLVTRRATREPLQHLTGTAAFRHVELKVGPGVFVPRPETELLAGWAIEVAHTLDSPIVVDLCTGSGAIALSVADEVPTARVYAVELDEGAHAWAARNLEGTGVELRHGDMATAFEELAGRVDIVVCNPPYIPLEAWESVAAEARDHDPHLALFSGDDGLVALRVLEERAARLLKPGGVVGAEHADLQGESAPEVFSGSGRWSEVRDHDDLAGRPRYLTARLAR
jgi:release factor glutamine methyltransferase